MDLMNATHMQRYVFGSRIKQQRDIDAFIIDQRQIKALSYKSSKGLIVKGKSTKPNKAAIRETTGGKNALVELSLVGVC